MQSGNYIMPQVEDRLLADRRVLVCAKLFVAKSSIHGNKIVL